jgi:RNA polymerase sigma factor (sigma-70 family)
MIPAMAGEGEGVVEVRAVAATDDLARAYRLHAAELTAFAAGLVGAPDAPDVVATAVSRIVAGGRWASVAQPRAYLYRAVYHEAISMRRQFARRARLSERLATRRGPGWVAAPAEPADPAVGAAIRALPGRQRAVIVLTYWQDLGVDEVGERLGIAPGTVKRHLARARENVRKALA